MWLPQQLSSDAHQHGFVIRQSKAKVSLNIALVCRPLCFWFVKNGTSIHIAYLLRLIPDCACMFVLCLLISRASQAVKCLDRVHSLKKRSVMPNSLYLDRLLRRARGSTADQRSRPLTDTKLQLLTVLDKVSQQSRV